MKMPAGETVFTDLIRGEVKFEHKYVPDFVLMRADGSPLYTLAVAVDDVLMKVTHILRGEDLLSSTPRQIRVYQAMGVAPSDYPAFAHLPFVMGQDNAKLSKRNGEVSIAWYKDAGYLPEAICNYLALLGWSPGDDVENVTMQQICDLFTVERVNSSPARFDMKKLQAINGDKIRALSQENFLTYAKEWLVKSQVISATESEIALLKRALPIIQERVATLAEIPQLLKFLFVKTFEIETESLTQIKNDSAKEVLQKSLAVLAQLENWNHSAIETELRKLLIEGMGLKPRVAFGPVRIAVTGSTISPPLFESLELLGKPESISRIKSAITLI